MEFFWKSEILTRRSNPEEIVLIVSHAAVIASLITYLISINYSRKKINQTFPEFDREVRNCSITEIEIGEKGPGEFIRHGDWSHIYTSMLIDPNEELDNSTG